MKEQEVHLRDVLLHGFHCLVQVLCQLELETLQWLLMAHKRKSKALADL